MNAHPDQRDANAPAQLRHAIWSELQRAAGDRLHEWRTPILATVDGHGMPQARTVVLRQVDPAGACLTFYTDRRSPKVTELALVPTAVFVFWSRQLNWQLRARARMTVQTDGSAVELAWSRLAGTAAAMDYLAPDAPGSLLQDDARPAPEVHQLAIVTARVEEMDWLALSPDGHRRARMSPSESRWVVP